MSTPTTDDRRSNSRPPRWQYGLCTLLVLTVAVAVACSVFFALPPWVSAVVGACMIISTPVVLTIMVVYGRGYTRAFCIGALFPAGFFLLPLALYQESQGAPGLLDRILRDIEPNIVVLIFVNVYWGLVLGNGLLAVWVRRLVERSGGSSPPPSQAADEAPEGPDTDAGASRTDNEES